MKIFNKKIFIISFFFCLIIWACKNPIEPTVNQNPTTINNDSAVNENNKIANKCNFISYSDTLVYLKPQAGDYKIEPSVRHDGEYGCIPEGLEINESNGEINITKSESGLKYKVFFIPKNTKDTCFTSLTISGIDYLSKIYNLEVNDSLVIPVYNSNPNITIPGGRKNGGGDDDGDSGSGSGTSGGSGSGSNSGSGSSNSGSGSSNSGSSGSSGSGSSGSDSSGSGSGTNSGSGSSNSGSGSSNSGKSGGSEFDDDEDDDNGDGVADEPLPGQQVTIQGVAIDKSNGKIELKKSLRNGFLGTNPTNGQSKKFKIYYRLDDNSGKALNSIEVQFHYFKTANDIPKELKDSILEKTGGSSKGRSSVIEQVLRPTRKPRPPDIVIVGRYQ